MKTDELIHLLAADERPVQRTAIEQRFAVATAAGIAGAGVLMLAHWVAQQGAARHRHPIRGALLVTPPDLDASWPSHYPSPEAMQAGGWHPLPRMKMPFPSLVVMSQNDPLASPAAVRALALDWGSELVDAGAVGHLNPASGFGPWHQAEALLGRLDAC